MYPTIYKVLYIPGGAGVLPSTVWLTDISNSVKVLNISDGEEFCLSNVETSKMAICLATCSGNVESLSRYVISRQC